MALDSRFMIAPSLEMLFRDKDTGLPLVNGTVTFYKDQARTEPKSVYILAGSPPNYSYTDIGNEITLSAIGTFQYNGTDTLPYYFPYDGTPDDSLGTVELYYVVVKNEDGTLQFTREGWPNFIKTVETGNQNLKNYVPNGQFLDHNNFDNDGIVPSPPAIQNFPVAPGGWYFKRPQTTSAKDVITFTRFSSPAVNPTGNPRWAITIDSQIPDPSDTYKTLQLYFANVNKFASDEQEYTFSFTGKSNLPGNINVDLYLVKNYGTGGTPSSTDETKLTTISVGTSYAISDYAFTFGLNTGKTLGTNNDDYVALELRLPVTGGPNISFTDIILTPDDVDIVEFPATTDADFLTRSLTQWTPDPDGGDLLLPVIWTKQGLQPDYTVIGKVYTDSTVTVEEGYLLADGTSYETEGYSDIGIPYSRLQDKYWNSTYNFPLYGTGYEYLSCYATAATDTFQLCVNTAGTYTGATDGTVPTNFTFTTNAATGATAYNYTAYKAQTPTLVAVCNTGGIELAAPGAGTSGFTIVSIRPGTTSPTTTKAVFVVETIVATTLAGKYFLFSNTTTSYYMWFKVDGAGADPAVGGRTGILVQLLSTMSADDVCNVVREALSGLQTSIVKFNAASTVTAASWWYMNAPLGSFYIWYKKAGVGTDPAPSGKIGIEVDIGTSDTAAQVASKTQIAINQKYFGVPDYRSMFFRMMDGGRNLDPDSASRWTNTSVFSGDAIGTMELDDFLVHNHSAAETTTPGDLASGVDIDVFPSVTGNTGGHETRPLNMYINYLIKY